MSHSQLLHFDSIYGTYNSLTNTTTGVSTTPYNSTFTLKAPIRKVRNIYLKTCEIPVTFANVRAGSTNTLTLVINGTTYTLTLAEKLYTTIPALILDLNTAAAATITGSISPVFALTASLTTPYRLTITSSASTLSVVTTNLSQYILGFRSTDVFTSGMLTSGANYNLSIDNYLNFYISNISALSPNVSGVQTTFKIPLNAANNSIFYFLESSCFQQYAVIQDPNFILSYLNVYVRDRFGNDINPQGGDFSFTLLIEYDI